MIKDIETIAWRSHNQKDFNHEGHEGHEERHNLKICCSCSAHRKGAKDAKEKPKKGNPKSEARNTKQIQMTKFQKRETTDCIDDTDIK